MSAKAISNRAAWINGIYSLVYIYNIVSALFFSLLSVPVNVIDLFSSGGLFLGYPRNPNTSSAKKIDK